MTHADRRDVQIALARLGYYDGQIDGLFGPDARAAIRRWQHEVGAEMTGMLSGTHATRLVNQQVLVTMGGGNALARVNRHIRQTQIVIPPARPRPWWHFW
jgi:peptidoglycan hydrolase-like protein with peptidoglycan-binding domain